MQCELLHVVVPGSFAENTELPEGLKDWNKEKSKATEENASTDDTGKSQQS